MWRRDSTELPSQDFEINGETSPICAMAKA